MEAQCQAVKDAIGNLTIRHLLRGRSRSVVDSRFSSKAVRGSLVTCLVALAGASVAAGQVVFDGTLDFTTGGEWADYKARAVQDNHTGFGDQIIAGFLGSELDELYVRTDGTYLYIGVTGNLQENGNAIILLLDTDLTPGTGQNVLATEIAPNPAELPCASNGPPFALQNLGQALTQDEETELTIRDPESTGTVLDEGFEPDYAIAVDTFGGTVHVTQYTLSATPLGQWDDPITGDNCEDMIEELDFFTSRVFRGQVPVGGGGTLTGGENPNGSEFAFDNSGFMGVTDTEVAPPGSGQPGDPRTQTTGLEARISLLDLGFDAGDLPLTNLSLRMSVLLTSGGGIVSNQVLPGIGAGTDPTNLDFRPDFTEIAGNQFVEIINLAAAAFSPDIDGDMDPGNEWAIADIVASQDTVTGFGDRPEEPNLQQAGSEINQMFIKEGEVDEEEVLLIGITGNLETNGNNLVIFLDTLPGGQSTLNIDIVNSEFNRLDGMTGDTIPLEADFALVINTGGGAVWVDFVNLITNEHFFIGSNAIDSGDGILDNDGPVPAWRVALNNSNVVGVNADSADDPVIQQNNALSATTGFEIAIPRSAVGSPADDDEVCVFALVTNSNSDFHSNQVLPAGIGGGLFNLGGGTTDFTLFGFQCLSMTLGPGIVCNVPRYDADGDGDVDMEDFAYIQRCIEVQPLPEECVCFDFGGFAPDGVIDGEDLALFLVCMNGNIAQGIAPSGPSVPADEDCASPPE